MLSHTYSSPWPLAKNKRVHWNHIQVVVMKDLLDNCQPILHQVLILAPYLNCITVFQ